MTQANIHSVLTSLKSEAFLALDTETTGLRPYHGDEPFAVIIANAVAEYYFDFAADVSWRPDLRGLFEDERTWACANAKFDMAMLSILGYSLKGPIHDLQVHERVIDSTLWGKVFSLDAIAARYDLTKDAAVERWIEENRCYTEVRFEGKKKKEKKPHYDRVPKSLIIPYACQDARITYDIARGQIAKLIVLDDINQEAPKLDELVVNERALTRVVYDMERVGVQVDLAYCQAAGAFESGRERGLKEKFHKITGTPFVDSAKCFGAVFVGVDIPTTPKGNPSYAYEVLKDIKHPVAEIITDIRDAKHKSDYYYGFLYHADCMGTIHASFNQFQTVTGRFSSSSPNLQNLSRPEKGAKPEEFQVRRAIVPRPGTFFVMMDYDQMEYRMMLEYAGCRALIEKVLEGLDVHEATSQLAGVTRDQAKTANFLTLYGGGIGTLARKLGVSSEVARRIRNAIFEAAPEIKTFIAQCTDRASRRGYIYNWFGRRQYFPDSETSYRAANHLIQGGCADTIKKGMVAAAKILRGRETKLVLSVHDELVFQTVAKDLPALLEIKDMLEDLFPSRWLKLTVSMDHSFKSLADKIEGLPA